MEIEKNQLTSDKSTPGNEDNSSGFSQRLREAMQGRSIREFASSASMAAGTLHNYLNDESLPTLDKLIALANTASVSLNWLATGRGTASRADDLDDSVSDQLSDKINIALLTEALVYMEQVIGELNVSMSAEKKGSVTALIYDLFLEQDDQPVNREKVFRLIERAIS